jgi:hypothetical protein
MIRQGWSRTVRLSGPNMNELHGFTEERVFGDDFHDDCDCEQWHQKYLSELGLRRRIVGCVVGAFVFLLFVRFLCFLIGVLV